MRACRRTVLQGAISAVAMAYAGRPHAAHAAVPVDIGFPPSGDFMPAIIASEKGFFPADRMAVRTTMIALISNVPAALLSGSVQIGGTTGPTLMQAVDNGLDLVAVSGCSRWTPDRPTASLLAAAGSGATTAQDLVGKRVAVPGTGSVMDLLFRRWLLSHGVQPSQVQPIEASFPQMSDMLRSRQVDAALVKEPFVELAISRGAATRLADYVKEVDPHGLNVFWAATRAWAEQNPAAIAGFRAGLRQGTDFFLHDPEAKAIELRVLKTNARVLPEFDTNLTVADLSFQQELARQFGLIEHTTDPSRLIIS
jgi:NitT/TauT family transport system substrate-binding protein